MRVGMTDPQADLALIASMFFQIGDAEWGSGYQSASYTDSNPTQCVGHDMVAQSLQMAGIVYRYYILPTESALRSMRVAASLGAPALLFLPDAGRLGQTRVAWAHAHRRGRVAIYRWVDHNRALACQPLPELMDVVAMLLLSELVTLDMDEVPVLSCE